MAQEMIGKYRIIELIASGTQGSVYRAYDPDASRLVAIKVLHPGLTSDATYIERFQREASIAASVDHPNVVEIFDVGEDGGQQFIVLEFLPENLARLIETGALPVERAVGFAIGIADGVGAVHELGIIHRDLKPQNVLIAPDGTPKVTDFGIARGEGSATMTGTGVLMGTPYYMSPEQAEGKRADERSDVYALGCVLYQMLTGEVPFEGETPMAVLRMHIEVDAPRVDRLQPDVPAEVVKIVARALTKDPNARFANASVMAAALRVAVPTAAGIAVAPPPDDFLGEMYEIPDEILRGRSRFRVFAMAVAGVAVAAVVGGLAVTILTGGGSPTAGSPPAGSGGNGPAAAALPTAMAATNDSPPVVIQTVVVEREVPGETVIRTVVVEKIIEVPGETVIRTVVVEKIVEVPGETVVQTVEVEKIVSEPVVQTVEVEKVGAEQPVFVSLSLPAGPENIDISLTGSLLFQDLMDGDSGLQGGRYDDGVFVLTSPPDSTETAQYSQSRTLPSNFSIEIDLLLEGRGRLRGGLILGSSRGYIIPLDLTDQEVQFWPIGGTKADGFQLETIDAEQILTDGWNHLQLISTEGRVWILVNGELAGFTETLDTLIGSLVRFHVSSFGSNTTTAMFDNLVIRAVSSNSEMISEPTPLPTPIPPLPPSVPLVNTEPPGPKIAVIWAFQPNGSNTFDGDQVVWGEAIIRASNGDDGAGSPEFGLNLDDGTLGDWVSDIYYGYSGNAIDFPGDFWANNGSGGVSHLGAVSLESVESCPAASVGVGPFEEYNDQATAVIVGHTYCIITRDGGHFAKLRVERLANYATPTAATSKSSAPFVIAGRAITNDGQPVPGLDIAVIQGDVRVDAITGPDGRYSVFVNTPGDWSISSVGLVCDRFPFTDCERVGGLIGVVQVRSQFTVPVPPERINLTFEFVKTSLTISGRVLDSGSRPISGARVFANGASGEESWTTSLDDGSFDIPVTQGKWTLRSFDFRTGTSGTPKDVEVGETSVANIDVEFRT